MKDNEIREHIFQILHGIAPEAALDSLDPNENLREALDIDSFDFLKVIIGLSERFGVNIPEADYRQVSTLNEMMQYLSKCAPSTNR